MNQFLMELTLNEFFQIIGVIGTILTFIGIIIDFLKFKHILKFLNKVKYYLFNSQKFLTLSYIRTYQNEIKGKINYDVFKKIKKELSDYIISRNKIEDNFVSIFINDLNLDLIILLEPDISIGANNSSEFINITRDKCVLNIKSFRKIKIGYREIENFFYQLNLIFVHIVNIIQNEVNLNKIHQKYIIIDIECDKKFKIKKIDKKYENYRLISSENKIQLIIYSINEMNKIVKKHFIF